MIRFCSRGWCMNVSRIRSIIIIAFAVLAAGLVCAENVRAHAGWGIVVDRQGQIYFSDIPTNTIWRITREGKLEAFLSNKHSHALVLGEDGSVYGTHEHQLTAAFGRVWRIAPDGTFSDIFSPDS